MTSGRLLAPIVLGAVIGACSAAPLPAEPAPAPAAPAPAAPAPLAPETSDICAPVPGKPPPKPLERTYTGVAAKARCQDQVFKIMGGVTHFLGVKCAYCHLEPDYKAMTHRKQIANWMAQELIPRLEKKGGGEVWCRDCHIVNGKGTAKILKSPRDQRWAVEWMTTHLVDDFETRSGAALRCKNCHQANLGSPGFQRKIILTDRLPKD